MNQIKVGDILYRSKLIVQHAGVMLDNGKVLHNSPTNGAEICTFNEYAQGKVVKVISSDLDIEQQNQFKQKGVSLVEQAKEYDLFDFNCEHLVSLVKSGKPTSSQLNGAIVGASVGVVIAKNSKNPLITIGLCSVAGLLATNLFREYNYTVS
ncbi:hypothetical protein CJF42_16245 [Pseudoalteromonas sp. NBT06-2]|uniref:hypothetical protein n=1 Tax=Pseudoalteromonas sp. NBT06-2 TaxID=2025950 RepID=UPI000BA67986|nr:hypothetical protein [Pseudoalteromonas sp. NBT06-2]PAJ73341.1 hypothetical protein CJF42_16245 [Pseudoalteromonas sp. NBT06-2]